MERWYFRASRSTPRRRGFLFSALLTHNPCDPRDSGKPVATLPSSNQNNLLLVVARCEDFQGLTGSELLPYLTFCSSSALLLKSTSIAKIYPLHPLYSLHDHDDKEGAPPPRYRDSHYRRTHFRGRAYYTSSEMPLRRGEVFCDSQVAISEIYRQHMYLFNLCTEWIFACLPCKTRRCFHRG